MHPITWEIEAEKLLVRGQPRFHVKSMPEKKYGIYLSSFVEKDGSVRNGGKHLLCVSKNSAIDSSVLISAIYHFDFKDSRVVSHCSVYLLLSQIEIAPSKGLSLVFKVVGQ